MCRGLNHKEKKGEREFYVKNSFLIVEKFKAVPLVEGEGGKFRLFGGKRKGISMLLGERREDSFSLQKDIVFCC